MAPAFVLGPLAAGHCLVGVATPSEDQRNFPLQPTRLHLRESLIRFDYTLGPWRVTDPPIEPLCA